MKVRMPVSPGPLTGVTVLEIAHILSGPFCTMLLADLGAEVIKVERPGQGDPARRLGPQVGGQSAYFMSVNRGKKSLSLDLSHEEGGRIARELARKADVLVENFIPGALARLGLDYRSLCQTNPGLVFASISGFGQDGVYRDRPALDIIVQAMGGIMSVTGEPGGPPLRPGVSLGDSIAGLYAALAIVTALRERDRTGRGSYIDMSMLDCQVSIMENALSRFFATGSVPGPMGSRHPAAVPFQAFATRDGHIVVAILSDSQDQWRNFCTAIGHPQLAGDPRFKDGWSRTQNYAVLQPVLDAALRAKPSREWLDDLSSRGIPCGPVNTIADVVCDPQVQARGMIAEIPHGKLGSWRVANTPFRIGDSITGPQGPSPECGEHTDMLLRDMLGLTSEMIAGLRARGTI